MFKKLGFLTLLVITACATSGEQSNDRVGDKYEIALKRTTETSGEETSFSV